MGRRGVLYDICFVGTTSLMSQFRLTYLVTVRPNLIKNTDTLGVIGGNTAQWLA